MTTDPNSTIDIPKDGYVAFDAMSLRQLIINRLNEQNVFTDQNFIGSNLASIIDIIAYSYHTLIYYLNKTSTESMFSEAQLYENINRIVKTIDYKPVGFQTSTLTFNCSALGFERGLYTIPRYSYVVANNVAFSFNEDITFAKTLNDTLEDLTELSQQKLLFQGRYQEYPVYTATGDDNETLILDVAGVSVDHFNIDVYVKSISTNTWKLYTKTQNLYLDDGYSEKYEIRLNGNNRYEIKFGNDINGKKLQAGDSVAVYFISSNGVDGEIGPNTFGDGTQITFYRTPQYNTILADVNRNNDYRYLTQKESIGLYFANPSSSTFSQEKENAEQIRENAPAIYKSQYRLVTTKDYENFVKTNFANIIADIKTVNNWEYVSGYLKYFYDIGLTDPTNTERALFNQVQYADSCNFNNVYLIIVPKATSPVSLDYLLPVQKEFINSSILPTKMTTTETTFIDPVYKAVSFGMLQNTGDEIALGELNLCTLNVYKKTNSRRDSQAIKKDIANIFYSYFSKQEMKLGQILDLRLLTQLILEVEGVDYFNTVRAADENNTVSTQGLSFFVWNPLYPDNDKIVTQNNVSSRYFEYYYFADITNIETKINVLTVTSPFAATEY